MSVKSCDTTRLPIVQAGIVIAGLSALSWAVLVAVVMVGWSAL